MYSISFTVLTSLTIYPTSWIRVLLEKPTIPQLVKKFPAFKDPQSLNRAVTSLPAVPVLGQTNPEDARYPISWRYMWILVSNLRLGLPRDLFPSGFCTKTLNAPVFSSMRATHPTHLFLLNMISRTRSCVKHRSWSFWLCNLFQSPVKSSHLLHRYKLQVNISCYSSQHRLQDKPSFYYKLYCWI